MKNTGIKLMAILFVGTVGFMSCSKNESANPSTTTAVTIEQKNKALVIDVTGTWCPPCGAYGIPGFNYAIENAKDKIVPFAVHSSDPLSVTAMNAVSNLPRFKSSSVPRIAAGNGLVFSAGVYSDIVATGNKIISSVDTFIANNPVTAGIALNNLKFDGTKVSVDVSTKFFNAQASGDYQLAIYFYENGVVSPQQKSGLPEDPNQQHDHVIRTLASATAWGEAITVSGNTNTKNYSANLNSKWNTEKMGAIAIIWKKIGTDYLYINGNLTKVE
jgi:thiol-disulfide isomerase/thioredoxin